LCVNQTRHIFSLSCISPKEIILIPSVIRTKQAFVFYTILAGLVRFPLISAQTRGEKYTREIILNSNNKNDDDDNNNNNNIIKGSVPVHAITAYRRMRGRAPLNLGIRWE
jgi:hypothetical protein